MPPVLSIERIAPPQLRQETAALRHFSLIYVGLGSNPDFLLGGRTSASAECRHWSGRAVRWSPLGVGAFFSEGLAMTATTPRPHGIVYVSGITRTPPRQ